MISSASTASGAVWGQLQQQMAERSAEQAEQRARTLQDRAQSAQAEADRAQENARSLKIESNQAQGDAQSARRGLVARDALGALNAQFGNLREQIADVVAPQSSVTPASAPTTAFTNSDGQATGTLINVTA